MNITQAIEELKKGNKIKHKTWKGTVCIEFIESENLICLQDNFADLYFYKLETFLKGYEKYINDWEIIKG